jgi:hypothetical protein
MSNTNYQELTEVELRNYSTLQVNEVHQLSI